MRTRRYAAGMKSWEVRAREAVRHTMAAYNAAGDRGRLDELAATFATDGALQIGDADPIVGPQAIVAELGATIRLDPAPRFVHHHVSGLHFRTVAPESIEVSSYFQVLTDAGLDHWGRYRDRFVPVGDRWLIAHRRIVADAFAPTSCFTR